MTVNGQTQTLLAGLNGASTAPAPIQIAASSLGTADTLVLVWNSKVAARIPVRDPDTSGIVASIDTSTAIAWNDTVSTYGTVYDARDGWVYRTVKIGSQTWMGENLNFSNAGSIGLCYETSAEKCITYGRLYTWSEAMANAGSSTRMPSGVRGICPIGWHVPSDTEWTVLSTYIGGESSAGTKLKSASGWNAYNGKSGNGTDLYGFRALPAGYRFNNAGAFNAVLYYANFWSTSELGMDYAWDRFCSYNNALLDRNSPNKTYRLSLRCVQD
ncbi:MAG: hypothetical protein RL173_1020 [Fibrobacterota bacterium]